MIADVIAGREPWCVQQGDALSVLRTMPDGCVQCCMTSPPYFSLRSYLKDGHPDKEKEIGLEKTPEAYVAKLVEVFREVWRVLRRDGVLFVNLGDSFCSTDKWGGGGKNTGKHTVDSDGSVPSWAGRSRKPKIGGVKPKDLIGIPWMTAFALRADGWYLRQCINWQKTAPMPGSQQDRPTTATEEIFLLAKSPRYFYDIDACRVPVSDVTIERDKYTRITDTHAEEQYAAKHDHETVSNESGRNLWNWWDIAPGDEDAEEGAAKLVWRLGPEPSKQKHFAQFPSEIPRRAVLLGTSAKGCCPGCGAPWKRMVEKSGGAGPAGILGVGNGRHTHDLNPDAPGRHVDPPAVATLGWHPTCKCPPADPVPCLVLDPFAGSATTGIAARQLGRRFIGIELSQEYATMGSRRISSAAPLDDACFKAAAKTEPPTLFD